MKISGIYLIRNKITEKFYVGSSIDIYRRWTRHKDDLNKNKHHSIKLQNSWNKHGSNNFDFIWVQKGCQSVLAKLEQEWINLCDSYKNGYNCNPIAENVGSLPKTEEHKRKIGAAHKGRKLSEESKDKIRQKALGRKGRKLTEEHKTILKQSRLGKSHTEEARKKISEARKGVPTGRIMSDAHKAAMLAGRMKNKQNIINLNK